MNDINFDLVNEEKNIIFACNQSVTVLSRCDYFCMTDCAVPKTSFFEHGIDIATKVIAFNQYFFEEDRGLNKFYEKLKDKIYFLERDTNNYYDFNKNNNLLIYGIDVVHVAAHLAYITGCTEIVLAGVDLTVGEEIYCKGTIFKKDVDWHGHVSKSGSLESAFNGWLKIKEQNSNIKFFNTTPGGRLSKLFDTILVESLYK